MWTSLLWILILLPVGNYLSTRYFFPALLAATAQIFLFVDCGSISLWGASSLVSEYSVVSPTATALFLVLLATLTAGYMTPKQSHLFKGGDHTANLWMEFSQLYGILWRKTPGSIGDSYSRRPIALLHPEKGWYAAAHPWRSTSARSCSHVKELTPQVCLAALDRHNDVTSSQHTEKYAGVESRLENGCICRVKANATRNQCPFFRHAEQSGRIET